VSDQSNFIAAFCRAYKAHRGAAYFVRRPKDLVLAKALLEVYSMDELSAMVDDLLTVEDEWIGATDRGIGILATKATWLANRQAHAKAEPVKEYWADVCAREHGSVCRSRWEHEMRLRDTA
jgi:hypothetical protein